MATKYWKHPQFGHVYGEAIATPIGRFSWPHLMEPKDPPPPKEGQSPGQPRYEVTLLVPKDEKATVFYEKIAGMAQGMLEIFNAKRSAPIALKDVKLDGDGFDGEKYPYYHGNWVLAARNAQQPQFKDKLKGVLEPSKILGGMLGRAIVVPIITSHGLSYKLDTVQLLEDDGVRFGGAVRDHSALLEAVEEGDTDAPALTGKDAAINLL